MHRCLSLTLLAVACAAAEDAPTIIVTADRSESDLARTPVSVSLVTAEAIEQRGGTLTTIDWLREIPGVGVFSKYGGIDGSAPDVRMRGLDSAYTQVLIDGIPVNDPSAIAGDLNFAFLAPAGIERLEVLQGSQSGLYGSRAIGGVAGFRTIRPTAEPRTTVSAGAGSFGTSQGTLQATGPLGQDLGYAVAIEGMRSRGFSTLTADPDGDPQGYEADPVSRLSWSARLEDKLDSRTTAYVAGMGSRVRQFFDDGLYDPSTFDYLPEASANDAVAGNVVDSNRVAAGFEHRGERLRLSADLSLSTILRENATIYGANSNFGTTPDPVTVGYRGREGYAAATAKYAAEAGWSLQVGGDGRWQQASQDRSDVGGLWSDHERLLGMFAQAGWSSQHLEVGLVGRHDDISGFGSQDTGRASAAILLADQAVKLRGSFANGFRSPSLYERFGREDAAFTYMGNPDLSVETSRSAEVGIDAAADAIGSLKATWFRSTFQDKITFDFPPWPAPNTMANAPGRSEVSGLETGGELTDIAGSGIDVAGDYTHLLSSDADHNALAYTPEHRGGVRVTANQAPTGRLSLWETVRVERLTPYFASSKEQDRMDGYTVASAALGVTLAQRYEASLRVENLTDERYAVTSSFGQTYATMPRAYFVTVKATF